MLNRNVCATTFPAEITIVAIAIQTAFWAKMIAKTYNDQPSQTLIIKVVFALRGNRSGCLLLNIVVLTIRGK